MIIIKYFRVIFVKKVLLAVTKPLKNNLNAPEVRVEKGSIFPIVDCYSHYSLLTASMLFESLSEVSMPKSVKQPF